MKPARIAGATLSLSEPAVSPLSGANAAIYTRAFTRGSAPASVITDPPQECPTRTTSPSVRSSALLVAVTSSARDVVGFCTAITLYPWSTSGLITLLQEEPSAQSPWTKTIVGFVFMEPPVCANAFELSDKTPTNTRMPIFLIDPSYSVGEGCKQELRNELFARRSTLNATTTVRHAHPCLKLKANCLSVGVKIELDHGPIYAPSMSALGQSRHVR